MRAKKKAETIQDEITKETQLFIITFYIRRYFEYGRIFLRKKMRVLKPVKNHHCIAARK